VIALIAVGVGAEVFSEEMRWLERAIGEAGAWFASIAFWVALALSS